MIKRKKVKFSSLEIGARFYRTIDAMDADVKTPDTPNKNLKSGYTNAKAGRFISFIDPNSDVWVKP